LFSAGVRFEDDASQVSLRSLATRDHEQYGMTAMYRKMKEPMDRVEEGVDLRVCELGCQAVPEYTLSGLVRASTRFEAAKFIRDHQAIHYSCHRAHHQEDGRNKEKCEGRHVCLIQDTSLEAAFR
jgi:hypothetical protein